MNPCKKPLHLVASLDGYGLSRQLEVLVEHQILRSNQVDVLALRADREVVKMLRQRTLPVRVLQRRWERDPVVAARLASELRRRNYDLLHLWGPAAVKYARAVHRFVPPLPTVTSLAAEQLPIGVAQPHTSEISREQLCAELQLPENARLIAVAGPLVRAQQIDEAIWHFELVRTLDENTRLLIFGDGPERHRLERFSRLTSEASAVRFLGYRRDFPDLLTHADVFWHTANAGEAIPQSVLEAMSAGLPVVANDTLSSRQVIEHGENGYLVAENDRAIFARHTRKLMQDSQLAQQLGEAAKRSVTERYSVEAMIDAYDRKYEECFGPTAPSPAR